MSSLWLFTLLVAFLTFPILSDTQSIPNLSRPSLVSQLASSVNSFFGSVQSGLRSNLKLIRQLMISDPDAVVATQSIGDYVRYNGYNFEEHIVTTKDRVLLQIHRIHNPNTYVNNVSVPVLLLHGVMTSGFDFIANLPHQSLGFFLADMGYDVWLGNYRGTKYGSLSNKSREFFYNATIDDHALYDTPAMIDYILTLTAFSRLHVVGHSRGAASVVALLTEQPVYNHKIRLFTMMAPAIFFRDMSLFLRILWRVSLTEPIKTVLRNLMYNNRPVFSNEQVFDPAYWFLTAPICALSGLMCETIIDFVEDPNFVREPNDNVRINRTRLGVIMSHFPAGSTFAGFQHVYQIKKAQNFQKYDYDDTTWLESIGFTPAKRYTNMDVYGTMHPPEYNVKNLNVSLVLFYSDFDVFSGSHDITLINYYFKHLIYNNANYHINVRKFLHLDFLWGLDARQLVYDPLYYQMKKYDEEAIGRSRPDENDIKNLYYTVNNSTNHRYWMHGEL